MKQWIAIAVVLCSFTTAFSQKQKEAKTLLDKTTELLQTSTGIELSFSSSVYQINSLKGSAEGNLFLKGESFMLRTDEMQTWYDGKTQWSLIFDMEEVNVSNPTEEELQEINPYQLLKLYRKGYSYVLGQQNTSSQEVILKAQSKDKNYQTIHVWINKKNFEPTLLNVYTKDNTQSKIEIKHIRKNVNLPASMFKFNEKDFPDVDIIDLR